MKKLPVVHSHVLRNEGALLSSIPVGNRTWIGNGEMVFRLSVVGKKCRGE